MCGIAGIIDRHSPPRAEEVAAMRDLMEYRGPDDCGCLVLEGDGVGLGHRRLSIFDTSAAGRQPMSDAGGRLHVVFNGEIFNFIEIREELRAKGYTFRTGTDTEVLLCAYDCWQERCLDRFIGMFAFALWDSGRKRLFIARDRLGIKPFYYHFDGRRFVFASEVKGVLRGLSERPPVSTHLIDAYMSFGYVPGEDTLLRGVKRLLPGHYGFLGDGGLALRPYWDLSFENGDDRGFDHYRGAMEELLEDSVRLRLRSDVPFGVFLSGGIDSSAVVAMVAPRVSRQLKTFSVRYDFGAGYDETPYARQVAAQYGTDHHELTVTPQDFMDFVPRYVHVMDEPVTEAAAISLFYLSRFAREKVTVTLSGEGSDEIFGGYEFYRRNLMIERFGAGVGRLLPGSLVDRLATVGRTRKLAKYLRLARLPLEERYRGISTYDDAVKSTLYAPAFRGLVERERGQGVETFLEGLFRKTEGKDPLSRMLYFDTRTWLVDDLLIKADRMSMAAAVELRVPFLDHRVVELAARIPSRYKIHHGTTKYLLKQMMRGKLPDSIIDRQKLGFPTPLEIMFRRELFGYVADMLLSRQAVGRGYFDRGAVEKMLDRHRSGAGAYHRELWQLLVLEEWHRQNVPA